MARPIADLLAGSALTMMANILLCVWQGHVVTCSLTSDSRGLTCHQPKMQIWTFPSPPLSSPSAHLLAASFAVSYVGSIYLSRHTRLTYAQQSPPAKIQHRKVTNGSTSERRKDERGRDDPEVIRARLVAVSVATFCCCLLFFAVLWRLIKSDYVG